MNENTDVVRLVKNIFVEKNSRSSKKDVVRCDKEWKLIEIQGFGWLI